MTRRITGPARPAAGRALATLARFRRRVVAVLAECNYTQRRMTILMTSPDAYLAERDTAPGDYAEFLFRTSGALLREPAAGRRGGGRLVG